MFKYFWSFLPGIDKLIRSDPRLSPDSSSRLLLISLLLIKIFVSKEVQHLNAKIKIAPHFNDIISHKPNSNCNRTICICSNCCPMWNLSLEYERKTKQLPWKSAHFISVLNGFWFIDSTNLVSISWIEQSISNVLSSHSLIEIRRLCVRDGDLNRITLPIFYIVVSHFPLLEMQDMNTDPSIKRVICRKI